MSGILSTLVRFFFTSPAKVPVSEETAATPSVHPDRAFAPIDSNLMTAGWFDGKASTRRDSIDSNPGTARWYRRPRFVSPDAATHRPSLVVGGE